MKDGDKMLSEKITELRKINKMSQEQLADVLDTSRQAVSKWERGESFPDIDKIRDLAVYFDVSIDYLLDHNIKASSVKNYIERIDKCLDTSTFDISIDEIKIIIKKNPNNFDLLSKAILYLGEYNIVNNNEEVNNLLIEYCERGITLFQKDNIAKITINDLQKAIITIYISQKKYELAKEYTREFCLRMPFRVKSHA